MPRIYIAGLNYQHITNACRELEVSRMDPNVIELSTSTFSWERSLRGIRFQEGDRLIMYGPWYEGQFAIDLDRTLNILARSSAFVPEKEYIY